MPSAAPFNVVVPLRYAYGAGPSSLTIPAGSTFSARGATMRVGGDGDTITTVDIGTLPSPPRGHSGYRLARAASGLPLVAYGYSGVYNLQPNTTLHLSPSTISEAGGSTTVTARLSRAAPDEVRLRVRAFSVDGGAGPFDISISANRGLTIARGGTRSTGTVTITAVDNSNFSFPSPQFEVSADLVVGSDFVPNHAGSATVPEYVTLRVQEDDPAPVVRLHLSASAIAEDGGSAEVSATLDRPLPGALSARLSARAVAPASVNDIRMTGNEVTIPAGSTSSTRPITITAVSDDAYTGDRTVEFTATLRGTFSRQSTVTPQVLTVTIIEDEEDAATALARGGICNRTPAMQTVLLRAIAGVTDCAKVTAEHLAAIVRLEITGVGRGAVALNSIKPTDFGALTGLRELTFNNTSLAALPVRVFADLANLQTLAISSNTDLTSIPDDALDGLSSLNWLVIYGNDTLRDLPAGLFADLSNLRRLDLDYNEKLSQSAGRLVLRLAEPHQAGAGRKRVGNWVEPGCLRGLGEPGGSQSGF